MLVLGQNLEVVPELHSINYWLLIISYQFLSVGYMFLIIYIELGPYKG